MTEDVTKRVYRQHNTKRGYEFFIDTISYRMGQCAGRVWIDKKADLSKQCSRPPHWINRLFCMTHLRIEQPTNNTERK